jgi:hypothetical protein
MEDVNEVVEKINTTINQENTKNIKKNVFLL